MSHRIEVSFRKDITDALGESVKTRITDYLGLSIDSVKTIDIYTIDRELNQEKLDLLSRELFADPITQIYSVDKPLAAEFDWLVEIGFKPGVTDNVGRTAAIAIEDMLKEQFASEEAVYTSRQYLIQGKNLTGQN